MGMLLPTVLFFIMQLFTRVIVYLQKYDLNHVNGLNCILNDLFILHVQYLIIDYLCTDEKKYAQLRSPKLLFM
jgi:hypothetical protein